jgi:hypothetical protein
LSGGELSRFAIKGDLLSAVSPFFLQEGFGEGCIEELTCPFFSAVGSHTLWNQLINQVSLATLSTCAEGAIRARNQGMLGVVILFVTNKAIHY